MKNKKYSQCPAVDCSHPKPNIGEFVWKNMPVDIQNKVLKSYGVTTVKRCLYCGTVWISYYDSKTMSFINKIIGTRNLESDNIEWILT